MDEAKSCGKTAGNCGFICQETEEILKNKKCLWDMMKQEPVPVVPHKEIGCQRDPMSSHDPLFDE